LPTIFKTCRNRLYSARSYIKSTFSHRNQGSVLK
jgi:hypothetical protein